MGVVGPRAGLGQWASAWMGCSAWMEKSLVCVFSGEGEVFLHVFAVL